MATLHGRGDDRGSDLLGFREDVGPEALSIDDDEVWNPRSDEPELPRHWADDLRSLVVSGHVVGCAADAPDLNLPEEVVVHHVVDDVDAGEDVVTNTQDDRLGRVD